MAKIQKHVYQFRRGTAQEWENINPILKPGEPGLEYDTNKLKIGNGIAPWKQLPYILSVSEEGQLEIITVDNHEDLPIIGQNEQLYHIISEKALYQWNDNNSEYETLCNYNEFLEFVTKMSEAVTSLEEDLSLKFNKLTDDLETSIHTLNTTLENLL